ncbi:GNAT family N-acetyltransferase [Umezawaea sp. NPDC059074]|uniref:GNAT family N-acetyltransferase n=1 Tax=Umezawaea sp. NPDC059074 TaxID=3346716 RepID=UPI003694F73F
MRIRRYRASDRDAVAEVCARMGGDPRLPDPRLVPSVFALPYVELEPTLAFVADDGGRVVGYVLGTADTRTFVRNYRRDWLPKLVGRYPRPEQEPSTPSEEMVELLHAPERMIVPELAEYPAHLHIDLLPEHQRAGHGRALMAAFVDALARAGVPGVHLGVLTANTAARAFYDRVGFHLVAEHGDVTYLGLEVGPNARLGAVVAG